MISQDQLTRKYINHDVNEVEGWLTPDATTLISIIDYIQKDNNISGDMIEIGVDAGKSFILLATLLRKDESILAVDVFEDQHLNVDGSGYGRRKEFDLNVKKYLGNKRKVSVLKQDSLELDKEAINQYVSHLRIASVDGCHTEKHTTNDIKVCQQVLGEKGVIFVDDVESLANFPGVNNALKSICSDKSNTLVPLLMSGNKLCMCEREDFEFYEAQVKKVLFHLGFYYPDGLKYNLYGKYEHICLMLPSPKYLNLRKKFTANLSYNQTPVNPAFNYTQIPSYSFIQRIKNRFTKKKQILFQVSEIDKTAEYHLLLVGRMFILNKNNHNFTIKCELNDHKIFEEETSSLIYHGVKDFKIHPDNLVLGENNFTLSVQFKDIKNYLVKKLIGFSIKAFSVHKAIIKSNSSLCYAKGFHPREVWGAWINGYYGELHLSLDNVEKNIHYLLKIQSIAWINKQEKKQVITIQLNDKVLGEVAYDKNHRLFIDYQLPKNCLKNGLNIIYFHIKFPENLSTPENPFDTRTSGLGIRGVDIYEIIND